MIKRQFLGFLIRWAGSALGVYLCYRFIFSAEADNILFYIISGLIFSIFNSILKPFLTLLTLPLSLITLGLSTVLINAGLAALAFWIIQTPNMTLENIIFSSLLMILLNGLVNFFVLPYTKK